MTEPEFVIARLPEHHSPLLSLNVGYMSWLFTEMDKTFAIRCTDVVGMSAAEYASSLLDKICAVAPPNGVFYLVRVRGKFSAMGGLHRLSAETAEIKRIYVQPDCRGGKLGTLIVDRLLADAANFGYSKVLLESAPFMRAAQRIYEAAGFTDRPPYTDAEVPEAFYERWRFMERSLAQHSEGGNANSEGSVS
jgi:ribosomal protein S18 acetylase RimI-like enzyme